MRAIAENSVVTDPVAEPETETEVGSEEEGSPSGPRIRCPLCGWSPAKNDLWACTCRYMWNTFDTAGVCPACLRQWTETQCLRCHQWSPHSDWYEQEA